MLDQLFLILILAVFPAAMAFAAASDLVSMTISNKISLTLVAVFFLLAIWSGMGLEQVGMHVLAGFVLLAVGFVLFSFGWIGGGDAKLMAATALWFGWSFHLVEYILVSAILGGELTIVLLLLRGRPLPAFFHKTEWVLRLHDEKTGVPYGIALAAAALTIYPQTYWMFEALGFEPVSWLPF